MPPRFQERCDARHSPPDRFRGLIPAAWHIKGGCAGSGCVNAVENYTYNNRLQPVTIELGTASNPTADFCLVYNYYQGAANPTNCAAPGSASSGDDGTVAGYWYNDNVNPSYSNAASYSYDALNRLTNASASEVGSGTVSYNLTFSYDEYGNMTCVTNGNTFGGPCPAMSYNSNNQLTAVGGTGVTYDAAGDCVRSE